MRWNSFWTRRKHQQKRRSCEISTFRPSFETLETRLTPVVGSLGFAQTVPAGGDFDGVVRVSNANGFGSGTLLYTGRHVLTAAHVVDANGTTAPGGLAGADGPVTVQFDMIRNGVPVPISWTVPAASIIVHPNWAGLGNIGRGYDLAIIPLEDQVVAGSSRHTVAPFGAQRFSLFGGNANGRDFVQVGYGESGNGTVGNQSDEVQRVSIANPVVGGTFTLTFNGQTTANIPQNASAGQVSAALAALTTITANSVMVNEAGLGANTWDIRFITINPQTTPPTPGWVGLGGQNVNQLTGAVTGTATLNIATQFNGGQAGVSQVKRLGENTIDAIVNVSPVNAQGNPTDPANNVVRYDFDNGVAAQNALGGLGLGTAREAFGARGDSGGPGFLWSNNRWEIAFVKSMIETPGITDLTDYRTAGNFRRFDFSYGEINRDALVAPFIDPFLTPNLTGSYHLVLDMNQQALGNDGITENLTITVRRNMVGVAEHLEIVVANNSAPGAFGGVYYSAPMTEIRSVTLRGSGDNETFIVQNTLARALNIDARGGADTIRLETLPAGISATLIGGAGDDSFEFSPALGDLNNIRGSVSIDGGSLLDDDYIKLNDVNANGNNRTYQITSNSIQTPGNLSTISYVNCSTLDLFSSPGSGATVNVQSTLSTFRTRIWYASNVFVGGPSPFVQNGGNTTRNVLGEIAIFTDVFNPQGMRTALTIDDSGGGAPLTAEMTDRTVTGMTGQPIDFLFARLSSLTINGGNGGNQFLVHGTGPSAFRGPVTLNTGLGVDTTHIYANEVPVTVNGQRGRDTVNVGSNGTMDGITQTLTVTNTGNWSHVNLDDSADATDDIVMMQNSGQFTQISGLSLGTIRLRSRDLASLNILGGSGGIGFTIDNTPASSIPGGALTTITTGSGNDMFGIRRTRGPLTINAMGGANTFNVGSFPVGSLNSIDGTIRLSGTGGYNGLSVSDDYTVPTLTMPTYSYIVDDDVIQRLDKAAIYYQDMTGINFFTSQAPDNVTVRGTKADMAPGDFTYIGTTVFGESDTITVERTTGQLYLAAGNQSQISVGTATSSLDNIQGLIRVSPTLNNGMMLRLNDTASTGHRQAQLSGTATSQTIQRAIGESPWRTLVQVNNVPVSNVEYQGGSGGTIIFVDSSSPNTTTTLLGHAGALDMFALGFAANMNQMQGTVISVGQSADYDFAYYYEFLNQDSHSYTVSTNIFFPHLMQVDRAGIAPMIFAGLNQVIFYAPYVGGNSMNVQGIPTGLFLNMAAGEGDVVTLGTFAPNLGGSLARIQGPFQLGAYEYTIGGGVDLPLTYRADVTLIVDDSGDVSPRYAVLDMYDSPPNYYESLVGLAPAGIYWNLGPRSSVSISGGNADDTFAFQSTDFETPIFLDGGDGIDTLDYSALNTGVTVNFPGQTASGLTDGFAGFDNVIGSAGNDILVGFGGQVLNGGQGRDLLIAGAFASILDGGNGEDILIGGTTDYDTNESALNAIMNEWSRTDIGYAQRVNNLLTGNGVPVLSATTVHQNGGFNQLTGGLGTDFFFAQYLDELLDLDEEETWISL